MPNEPPTDANFTQTGLVAATPQEIADALAYALRFDDRGKPRRNGWDFVASLAAERLTEHLQRAGFVVLRSQPGRLPHTAG